MSKQILENFVVLEGLDGAGTTTQLKLIEQELRQFSIPYHCTSEPTTGFIGQSLRRILEQKIQVHPRTVALLYAADRSEHLRQPEGGILARIKRGELVICDRYLFSSLAYQSLDCGFEFVHSLNCDFPLPRKLIFLDTPIALSQRRLKPRKTQELYDRAELQPAIQAAYRRAFALYQDTEMEVHHLDGSLAAERVFGNVWSILRTLPILRS